jgi:hypothetical protein
MNCSTSRTRAARRPAGYPDVRTAHLYEAGPSSAFGPQVVAAVIAGALTVTGILAAQYFRPPRNQPGHRKTLAEQGKQLEKTLAEQCEGAPACKCSSSADLAVAQGFITVYGAARAAARTGSAAARKTDKAKRAELACAFCSVGINL